MLLGCGVLLIVRVESVEALEGLLKQLYGLHYIAAYAWYYFYVTAGCFLLAGILAIINHPLAVAVQSLGSGLFVLTYDNPFLQLDYSNALLRCLFVLCHLMVIFALPSFSSRVPAPDPSKGLKQTAPAKPSSQ